MSAAPRSCRSPRTDHKEHVNPRPQSRLCWGGCFLCTDSHRRARVSNKFFTRKRLRVSVRQPPVCRPACCLSVPFHCLTDMPSVGLSSLDLCFYIVQPTTKPACPENEPDTRTQQLRLSCVFPTGEQHWPTSGHLRPDATAEFYRFCQKMDSCERVDFPRGTCTILESEWVESQSSFFFGRFL